MKIAITGGGTGGHLSIAKALGLECKKLGIYTLYIGSLSGSDTAWFGTQRDFGAELKNHDGRKNTHLDSKNNDENNIFDKTIFLDSTPVMNKKGLRKFGALMQNITQSMKAKRVLKSENIDAVISVGGFSAATGSFGAIFSGVPLFIHEQNAQAGALNKLLKPLCRAFISSFEYPNSIKLDYPINDIFFQKARIRENLNVISFIGGSQGARAINNLALHLVPILLENNIKIIHQSGKLEYALVLEKYKSMNLKITHDLDSLHECDICVFDFSVKMYDVMQKSDFCISRAGASSLFELSANALPSLFVPYPFATKNHQFFNAKMLSDKNLALLYIQKDIENKDAKEIFEEIKNVNLHDISHKLKHFVSPFGARDIINYVVDYIRKH